MELKLYNTLTRRKEPFRPLDPAHVRMYVCGPTVYDLAHIGNARPLIVFDVLYRLLRHVYGPEHVTYVRNITDVDDKINARAAERGISIRDVTEETYHAFQEDVTALGCLPPTVEPRATEYVRRDDGKLDMITLITRLIANGNAYAADGHVLFNVPSMPDYGRLSQRPLDEMIAGARVEVAPYKRDPQDFVLWKPSNASEPGWESPWGFGRPGWHIECSAMSAALLGETFDIHGGGIDLVFPHHENEIAQSRCAFQTDVMANVWMHNGYLQVEGEKMSKSLGNFVTVREQLDQWGSSVLRFNMLKTHYPQPIDWTELSLKEAGRELSRWTELLKSSRPIDSDEPPKIIEVLGDDLNTPDAITMLRSHFKEKNNSALRLGMQLLGISSDPNLIQGRKDMRMYAETGHYSMTGQPASLKFKRGDGSTEFDSETNKKIENLVVLRNDARKNKNFAESDRIRDELVAMGIVLKDSKNPATGELMTTWEVKR